MDHSDSFVKCKIQDYMKLKNNVILVSWNRFCMEMQCLILHRFDICSLWQGHLVIICIYPFTGSGLHHIKRRCDHTSFGSRTEAWICCFSCILHTLLKCVAMKNLTIDQAVQSHLIAILKTSIKYRTL